MPTPKPDEETRDEWMERCVPAVLDDGAAEDQDQAVAMCSSMWEDAKGKKGAGHAMNRAYSVLTVKTVVDDERTITGVATTPTPDRVGDIVEPLGVKFKNPMPLLHQHDARLPVGTVRFNKPTKDGVTFVARLPVIEVPGPLQDRVDTAWGEIKAGLVRGVSIGFREIDSEPIDDTFGRRFTSVEILETSLVTIPANADATIQTIKSFDDVSVAATGNDADVALKGDSFSRRQVEEILKANPPAPREKHLTKPKTTEKPKMETTQEKVKAFEAKRQAKHAAMSKIINESGDQTLPPDKDDEWKELKQEVDALDAHLERLNHMAKIEATKATPVNGGNSDDGTATRQGMSAPSIRVRAANPSLDKGIAFGRYVRCKALGHALHRDPLDVALKMYPHHADLHLELKTDIPAANTATSLWAGALVGSETSLFADFVEYLRPMTIIGQFGTNGVPALRKVPFRTPLITQTATTTGYWVGEGQPKPMSKAGFTRTTLLPYKCAALTAATMELLRDSSPSAEAIIRNDIAAAVATKLDTDFLDPQKGLESNVSPASISNGVTPINSSGRDADSVRADLVSVMAVYLAANNTPSGAVWVMSGITALQLSLLTNALGQPEFPGMNMRGGTLQGLPVITSEFLGYTTDSPTEGRDVFLINASDIYFGDDGGIDVRMSTEASLEMEDAPSNASAPTVAQAQLTSMFQTNSVAFLAERTVGWARRRTEAVVQLAQVEWGEASGVNV